MQGGQGGWSTCWLIRGGDLTSLTIILPLLWLGLGTLFMMIAFTDKTGTTDKRAQPKPRTLQTTGKHPLGNIHSALVCRGGPPSGRSSVERVAAAAAAAGQEAGTAPKRPAPRHGRSTRLEAGPVELE